jgi:hypothetical protein
MSNDTEYNDFDIDQLNEEAETELDTEHIENDEAENDDDEVAKLRSENKKLVEIIKRRKEREANPTQSKPTQTINTNQAQPITRDEAVLFAQGYSEEDVDYLNVVAKGTGLSMKEAKEHPIFVAYVEKLDKEKKAKRASMGTSKGSPVQKEVSFAGISAEEHKKIWKEKMGK